MNHFMLGAERNPIFKHLAYWTTFTLIWGLLWGITDFDFSRNILIQLITLPARMLLVYVSIYYFFPTYFAKKNYATFFLSYILLILAIATLIQRPLMVYYVQPWLLPHWDNHNFFGSAEIINTALDINIAAIVPLGYKILQTFKNAVPNSIAPHSAVTTLNNNVKYIEVKAGNLLHKISPEEILYIESQRNNSRIKLEDQELIVRETISSLQDKLRDQNFMRVHRSFLVNMQKISSFSPSKIICDNITIPVGRKYKQDVKGELSEVYN